MQQKMFLSVQSKLKNKNEFKNNKISSRSQMKSSKDIEALR